MSNQRARRPAGGQSEVTRREIRSWLTDMDGVLVREDMAIPGADRFLARLHDEGPRSSS